MKNITFEDGGGILTFFVDGVKATSVTKGENTVKDFVNSIRVGEFFELTNDIQEDQKQGVWESLGLVGEYLRNDLVGVFK